MVYYMVGIIIFVIFGELMQVVVKDRILEYFVWVDVLVLLFFRYGVLDKFIFCFVFERFYLLNGGRKSIYVIGEMR